MTSNDLKASASELLASFHLAIARGGCLITILKGELLYWTTMPVCLCSAVSIRIYDDQNHHHQNSLNKQCKSTLNLPALLCVLVLATKQLTSSNSCYWGGWGRTMMQKRRGTRSLSSRVFRIAEQSAAGKFKISLANFILSSNFILKILLSSQKDLKWDDWRK